MAAKIKELAERSGLSTATVSRILNGKGGHSAKAVKTLEQVMEDLGFGGGLGTQVPACVGIVMLAYRDFISNDYSSVMLSAIMEELSNEGIMGMIIPVTSGRLSLQYLKSVVDTYSLKGLIIQEFDQLYAVSEQLGRLDLPVVCAGDVPESLNCYSVCLDDYAAGRDAAAHLWSLGHRRFALVSMRLSNSRQLMRVDGFRDFITEMGGDAGDIKVLEYYGIECSPAAAIAEFASIPKPPTAIFSTNSTMTRKLLFELRRMKFRVPADISVISSENAGELGELETPVTAIAHPTRMLGSVSVQAMINLMRHRQIPKKQVFNCSLIIRNSTSSPVNN